jgi:hypothetical protein
LDILDRTTDREKDFGKHIEQSGLFYT